MNKQEQIALELALIELDEEIALHIIDRSPERAIEAAGRKATLMHLYIDGLKKELKKSAA